MRPPLRWQDKYLQRDMASPTDLNLTTAVENMLTAYIDAAGQATFGTTSHFEGIILSMTGIAF